MKKLLLLLFTPLFILLLCGMSDSSRQTIQKPEDFPDEIKEVYPDWETAWYKTPDDIVREATIELYKGHYTLRQLSTFQKQYFYTVEGGLYNGYQIAVNSTIYSDPNTDESAIQQFLYDSLWEIYQKESNPDDSPLLSRSEFERDVSFQLVDEWNWKQ